MIRSNTVGMRKAMLVCSLLALQLAGSGEKRRQLSTSASSWTAPEVRASTRPASFCRQR